MTLGRVLAYTGINKDLQVSCLPAYGAEMRGGYVYCTLVFSNGSELLSPVISRADIGIFLNDKSFQMLSRYLKTNGYLFLNSSLIQKTEDRKFKTLEIPASQLAESLGSLQSANMIMTGSLAFLVDKEFFPLTLEDVYSGVESAMADQASREVGQKALQAGWKLMEEKWK